MPSKTKQSVEDKPVKPLKTDRYFYGLGRRKSAVAQVRLLPHGQGEVNINNQPIVDYFPYFLWQDSIRAPLVEVNLLKKFNVMARVSGGGKSGQAEAVRLGVARALLEYDEDLRKALRAKGFLTRDPRVKERKKPGLKRARRSPQWSKR